MPFIIRATYRDETRNVTFNSSEFPKYDEIQEKLRGIFNLPSGTQLHWWHVYFSPNDGNGDCKFRRHVCMEDEYTQAALPLLPIPFPRPTLIFQVLLHSDPRLTTATKYHASQESIAARLLIVSERSRHVGEVVKLRVVVDALKGKLREACGELLADETSRKFWTDRIEEKHVQFVEAERKVKEFDEELKKFDKDPSRQIWRGVVEKENARSEECRREVARFIDGWLSCGAELIAAQEGFEGIKVEEEKKVEEGEEKKQASENPGDTTTSAAQENVVPTEAPKPIPTFTFATGANSSSLPSAIPQPNPHHASFGSSHPWPPPQYQEPQRPAGQSSSPFPELERIFDRSNAGSSPAGGIAFGPWGIPIPPVPPVANGQSHFGHHWGAVGGRGGFGFRPHHGYGPGGLFGGHHTQGQSQGGFGFPPPPGAPPFFNSTNLGSRPGAQTNLPPRPVPPSQPQPQARSEGAASVNGGETKSFSDRLKDIVVPPSQLLGQNLTHELKSVLDGFLVNLGGQLAGFEENFRERMMPNQTPTSAPASNTSNANTSEFSEKEREDAREMRMPGAFVSTAAAPSGPSTKVDAATQAEEVKATHAVKPFDDSNVFKHVFKICDSCGEQPRGYCYKCNECPDFDLCAKCLPRLITDFHPSGHTFTAIPHPDLAKRIVHSRGGVRASSQEGRAKVVRHNATCDVCDKSIAGDRFKCLDCPDWDSCQSCFAAVKQHHPHHSFVKVRSDGDLIFNYQPGQNVSHPNVLCDGCDKRITGIRYKCLHPTCADFDLCQTCEALPKRVHPADHPLLKMRTPSKVVNHSYFEQGEGQPVNTAQTMPYPRGPFGHGGRGGHRRGFGHGPRCRRHWENSSWAPKSTECPAAPSEQSAADKEDQMRAVETDLYSMDASDPVMDDRLPQPIVPDVRASPSVPASEAQPYAVESSDAKVAESSISTSPTTGKLSVSSLCQQVPELDAAFVEDITIPDGFQLPPHVDITKIWKLKNTGSKVIGRDCYVSMVAGDHFGIDSVARDQFIDRDVQPGEEFYVCIPDLRVPDKIGEKCVGYWRLFDRTGKAFGHKLWTEISVVSPDSAGGLESSSVIMPSNPSSSFETPKLAPATPVEIASQIGYSPSEKSVHEADQAEDAGVVEDAAQPATHAEEAESVVSHVPSSASDWTGDDDDISESVLSDEEVVRIPSSLGTRRHSFDSDHSFEMVESDQE